MGCDGKTGRALLGGIVVKLLGLLCLAEILKICSGIISGPVLGGNRKGGSAPGA